MSQISQNLVYPPSLLPYAWSLLCALLCSELQASEEHLKQHYADLSSKPFFTGLVKYMASGPLVPMVGTCIVMFFMYSMYSSSIVHQNSIETQVVLMHNKRRILWFIQTQVWQIQDFLKLYCNRSGYMHFYLLLQVWEAKNVVKLGRHELGETDPAKSEKGSIRGDYCFEIGR